MSITIVNLRHNRSCVRVDRTTVLGNPFNMHGDESMREQVCRQYAAYAFTAYNTNLKYRKAIDDLVDQYRRENSLVLGCWCAPKQCHAEVIRDLVMTLAPIDYNHDLTLNWEEQS